MQNEKNILRAEARRHRSLTDFSEETPDKAAQFFWESFPDLPKDTVIAGYWPKGKEFDSSLIIEQAAERGYDCALPVIQEEGLILKFLEWSPGAEMINGPYDIARPLPNANELKPDIILVPLLAFDRRGIRLGQGGGYYDATLEYLRKASPELLAIGTAYAGQAVLFNLPAEEHDQRLDMVITPKKVHDFRTKKAR